MPFIRPCKKRSSPKKPSRGLDDSPGRKTRSHTHRDQLCALFLTLGPAAVTRAIKVIETYDDERSSPQSLSEWDRLVAKHLAGHRVAQVKLKARRPAASRSSRSTNTPAAVHATSSIVWSPTNYPPPTFNKPIPFGWSPATNPPTVFFNTFRSSAADNTPGIDKLGLNAFKSRVKLTSFEDARCFNDNVLVVRGDIGSSTHIGDHKIDGIAFPTASSLRNSGIGAAAAVFRRAGDELSTHVQGVQWQSFSVGAGGVRVTSAFGAGVKKLIHAVGPSASTPRCYSVLEATYTSALEAAQREDLQCLAVASISTGNNGVPCEGAAPVALRAIQQFLAKEKWSGIVGIVCYEQDAFDAFTQEKQEILDTFKA